MVWVTPFQFMGLSWVMGLSDGQEKAPPAGKRAMDLFERFLDRKYYIYFHNRLS